MKTGKAPSIGINGGGGTVRTLTKEEKKEQKRQLKSFRTGTAPSYRIKN